MNIKKRGKTPFFHEENTASLYLAIRVSQVAISNNLEYKSPFNFTHPFTTSINYDKKTPPHFWEVFVISERTYFNRFLAGTPLFRSQFATVPSSAPSSFAILFLLSPCSYLFRVIFPPNVSVSWSNG